MWEAGERSKPRAEWFPKSHSQPPLLPPHPVSLSPKATPERKLDHFPAQQSCEPSEKPGRWAQRQTDRGSCSGLFQSQKAIREGWFVARQETFPSSFTPSQPLLPKLPPSGHSWTYGTYEVLSVFFNIHYLSLIAILYRWLCCYNNTHF